MSLLVNTGAQVVLANTYHLMLEPGGDRLVAGGGIAKYMGWHGPTMTDSGGFQVFSLGTAFGNHVSKVATGVQPTDPEKYTSIVTTKRRAFIDDDGVTFRSHRTGSLERLTPERSMFLQHQIGADMIFAFDECTSPTDPFEYQIQALRRTRDWAVRSIDAHEKLDTQNRQALFGVVQGGTFRELREQSATDIGGLPFDGFGIGGSFTKNDLHEAVTWATDILPENKPRHLLGIGEPLDLFLGVDAGCDTFDCVVPTRRARHGSFYTHTGMHHITNTQFRDDQLPLDPLCDCETCTTVSRAYISHLFRAHEMVGMILLSVHNIRFLVRLVDQMRERLIAGTYEQFKTEWINRYTQKI